MKGASSYLLTITLLVCFSLWADAQDITSANETNVHLTRVKGFGPRGTTFVSIGSQERSSPEIVKLYPRMEGIPEFLSNVANYYFVFQKKQFDFQNFRKGKISLEELSESFDTPGSNLKDTSELSVDPVRCGVGILTAVNKEGEPVYMVDCNNNHDFSDEVIRPLSKAGSNLSAILTEGVNIIIDFAEKGKIRKDTLYMVVRASPAQNQLVSLAFPEFRYGRLVYKDIPYVVCTEDVWRTPNLVVLPDIPYFNPVRSDEQRISKGQFVNLGGDIFQYIGYEENGKTIRLQGKDISQIDTRQSGKTYNQKASEFYTNDIKTAQVGFSAPDIKGVDINNGVPISLSDLRGKYVYVDFWSTSCGPCIADFPAYKLIYDKLDKTKIAFIGMADERTQGRVAELNTKFGLTWPTVLTNKKETITEGYHIQSYPTSFLVNPEGKIIHINLRPDNLKSVLQQLL